MIVLGVVGVLLVCSLVVMPVCMWALREPPRWRCLKCWADAEPGTGLCPRCLEKEKQAGGLRSREEKGGADV